MKTKSNLLTMVFDIFESYFYCFNYFIFISIIKSISTIANIWVNSWNTFKCRYHIRLRPLPIVVFACIIVPYIFISSYIVDIDVVLMSYYAYFLTICFTLSPTYSCSIYNFPFMYLGKKIFTNVTLFIDKENIDKVVMSNRRNLTLRYI